MRILAIEDEKIIAEGIKYDLEKYGFAVDLAFAGYEGEELIEINSYDLVLLDINLPDILGYDLCKKIREKNDIPIIMVTARTEIEERVQGFDFGADDYLTKPFAYAELRARIHAVLKRVEGKSQPSLEVGELRLQPNLYQAFVSDKELKLTMKEYEILYCLMLKHPEPQSLESIIEHVWNDEVNPFSNSARVHIMNLRKKIQEYSQGMQIKIKKERGYYLCSGNQ